MVFDESDAARLLAELDGWATPDRFVMVASPGAYPEVWPDDEDEDEERDDVIDMSASPAIFLASADRADDLIARLSAAAGSVVMARSWPETLDDTLDDGDDDDDDDDDGATWPLELLDNGTVPHWPVIDNPHFPPRGDAEPAPRDLEVQELVTPFRAETPTSRELLSATLLIWLETGESVSSIAAILGVHPQTVRYRWRRINDLFGEALHEPEFVVQLTLC